MNKTKQHLLSALFIALTFWSETAKAEPIAGEILKSSKSEPYAEFEPRKDIITAVDIQKNKTDQEPDIYFSADQIEGNENQGTITAKGDVVVKRDTLTLHADILDYNQKQDTLVAKGNVLLEDESGTKIFADNVSLAEHMNRAEINKIKVLLVDESKVWAESFRQKANGNKVMRNAVYTPCDFCENISTPLWRIRARKVTHDDASKDVNYNDAFLDVKNVPVLYTPFLSHPDPSVKRRSGFLAPKIGSSSYLGSNLQLNYYFAPDDSSDFLFSPTFSNKRDVLWGGAYRQYFQKGELNLEGTYLNDDNKNRSKNRGNLFAFGRYEINDKWVFDTNIEYASDNLYLKELSLDKDDQAWLTSNMRFQRFNNRDYAAINAYYYKLISYDLRQSDSAEYSRRKNSKPIVAPLVETEFLTDPNSFGAYFKNDFGLASIYHSDGVQSHRVGMVNSWNLPWVSPFGERYKIVASVKTDAYHVADYRNSSSGKKFNGNPVRVFPQLGVEWKLPFVKASEDSRQIIEPVIVAAFAPNGGNQSDKIPNEDSQDAELADTNILNLDRYAGYDRNDVGSRISYGFNYSSYGNIMGRTSAFVAQTYELNKNSSFMNNIDSSGHLSDYVGRIYAAPADYLDLNYRFRLDHKKYSLRYSELGARAGSNLLNLYVSYIYLQKNSKASEPLEERKELYTSFKAGLTKDWSVSIYNRQDLSHGGGSLEHGGNLIYEDECFTFITTIKKSNSNDPELDDSYEFNFTFYLKTLGGLGS